MLVCAIANVELIFQYFATEILRKPRVNLDVPFSVLWPGNHIGYDIMQIRRDGDRRKRPLSTPTIGEDKLFLFHNTLSRKYIRKTACVPFPERKK